MPKHLFVFSDGTWNTPEQEIHTNIFRLTTMVSLRCPEGNSQLVFYDPGIGTEGSIIERTWDGAVGRGIDLNIQQLYTFLAMNYEDGDSIYLFGFSRGAYTVRSLAGMINESGLLRREHLAELKEAYDLYRDNDDPESDTAKTFRDKFARRVPIKLLACFDTVGALGLPVESIPGGSLFLDRRKYEFHDTKVGAYVEHAIHILSIDEDRKGYLPTYMQPHPERGPDQVTELFMPGYHSGVGGGKANEKNLSDNALRYMIMEIERRQLNIAFRRDMIPEEKDPCLPPQTTSFKHKVIKFLAGEQCRDIKSLDMLHESAFKRYCSVDSWRPLALKKFKSLDLLTSDDEERSRGEASDDTSSSSSSSSS